MEPIQPIGPRDREVEPVLRVRQAPREERRDRREGGGGPGEQPRREPGDPAAEPFPSGATEDEDGGTHIDIRV